MIIENLILLFGIAIIFGYFVGKGTYYLRITSIVGYILTGVILGPLFHIIELSTITKNVIVNFTLALIGFTIGGTFTLGFLKSSGKTVWVIIVGESFGAFFLVLLGIYLYTGNIVLALVIASLAPASAPAGTIATLRDTHASGPLTRMAIAVVGLDDATSIILFVIAIAIVHVMLGGVVSAYSLIMTPLIEIFGAFVIGGAFGALLAYLIKLINDRDEILILTISIILISAGLSQILHVSLILASMALGAVVVNVAPSSSRISLSAIDTIIPPIFVIFFVVAGLELNIGLLAKLGIMGVIYIVARATGLISGAYLGAKAGKAMPVIQKYLGFAILSQAGVAIGLALLVKSDLAQYGTIATQLGTIAITMIAATTVVFEIIGPIGTRFAVKKAGEIGK